MKALDTGFTVSSYIGLYVWVYPIFLRVSKLLGMDQTYINKFNFRHIQKSKQTMKHHRVDLPSYIVMKLVQKQAQDPHGISDWDILTTAGSNVGAGSDTTAISLSSTLYHLLKTPVCLAKLRSEIQDSGIGSNPTFKETQAMPYLQAVLKEALRIHPGTGYPLFRVVPKGGAFLAGQFFPEGVRNLQFCVYMLLANKVL
jgi:cytochrome P450